MLGLIDTDGAVGVELGFSEMEGTDETVTVGEFDGDMVGAGELVGLWLGISGAFPPIA